MTYAKENTALVTSFLSTPFTQIIGVDEDTSIIDAISSVGGLMGLFMGFTMVTLAEVIYYSSSLLITSVLGIKRQVRGENKQITFSFPYIFYVGGHEHGQERQATYG